MLRKNIQLIGLILLVVACSTPTPLNLVSDLITPDKGIEAQIGDDSIVKQEKKDEKEIKQKGNKASKVKGNVTHTTNATNTESSVSAEEVRQVTINHNETDVVTMSLATLLGAASALAFLFYLLPAPSWVERRIKRRYQNT
jgi:hypothetical protein